MERIRENRIAKRRRALENAKRVAECIGKKIPESAVILIGSYARGDFNKWSDVDILVVASGNLPSNPLRRLETVQDCLTPDEPIEPVILTLEEFLKQIRKRNPLAREATEHGTVLRDRIGLGKILQKRI